MRRAPNGLRVFSEFKDAYGSKITVKESSAWPSPRCWVFCENDPQQFKDPAPHLSPAQARRLAKALLKFSEWVEKGGGE